MKVTKPNQTDAEKERLAALRHEQQGYCDLIASRAAAMMAEKEAPVEMIIDRLMTYAVAQCFRSFGRKDALVLVAQARRAVERGDFDHLQKSTD